jgi:hypothetical protein
MTTTLSKFVREYVIPISDAIRLLSPRPFSLPVISSNIISEF